tara:strand:+ start:1421 stop:1894 length:474 start_codon:yes stop_codon:yes gene_type:complete
MKTELPILKNTEEQKEKLLENDPLYYQSKLIFTLQTLLQDNAENTKSPNPEFLKKIFKHSIKTYLSNTENKKQYHLHVKFGEEEFEDGIHEVMHEDWYRFSTLEGLVGFIRGMKALKNFNSFEIIEEGSWEVRDYPSSLEDAGGGVVLEKREVKDRG